MFVFLFLSVTVLAFELQAKIKFWKQFWFMLFFSPATNMLSTKYDGCLCVCCGLIVIWRLETSITGGNGARLLIIYIKRVLQIIVTECITIAIGNEVTRVQNHLCATPNTADRRTQFLWNLMLVATIARNSKKRFTLKELPRSKGILQGTLLLRVSYA